MIMEGGGCGKRDKLTLENTWVNLGTHERTNRKGAFGMRGLKRVKLRYFPARAWRVGRVVIRVQVFSDASVVQEEVRPFVVNGSLESNTYVKNLRMITK